MDLSRQRNRWRKRRVGVQPREVVFRDVYFDRQARPVAGKLLFCFRPAGASTESRGHLAGVWDGKQLCLYVDGILQESRLGIENCSSLSDVPFYLGADPANPALGYLAEGLFHGRFRAVRSSHSVEYATDFAKPERFEKTPQTPALFDFTIDTGRYAIDRSGHGRHGIIVGAKFVPAALEKAK